MHSHNINEIPIIDELDLEGIPPGSIRRFRMNLVSDATGQSIYVPVLVAKGVEESAEVLGLTAAIHGDELNGIAVIQQFFRNLDPQQLRGTIIGIPIANLFSYHHKRRRFTDNTDLNHVMPGVEDGSVSKQYAYRFFHRLIVKMTYLVDMHTASRGRINSFYIRANLSNPIVAQMAKSQDADIILDNPSTEGTLRAAATALGIRCITTELVDPNILQTKVIERGIKGVKNLCVQLNFLKGTEPSLGTPTVYCQRSYWIYTKKGGLLEVEVELREIVQKGAKIASLYNMFGDLIEEYFAPETGIIIGKSVGPVNQSGGRIVHFGILK